MGLEVLILNPTCDIGRVGSRYCVGGYIYQVKDDERGELLSGPQYPEPRPDVFHGQGAPDAFVTALGAEHAALGAQVAVIGVGRVRRTDISEPFTARNNPEVTHFLPWEVTTTDNAVRMTTEDEFDDYKYKLTRTVKLAQRNLESYYTLHNMGAKELPIKWFAHPFFPLNADQRCCRFEFPVTLPGNAGYTLDQDRNLAQRSEFDWREGLFVPLSHAAREAPTRITQYHDKVGSVLAEMSFVPDWLPIWSNDRTFSFEPYYIRDLAPSASLSWSISYYFAK